MNAEHTANSATAAGWVSYDGTCPLRCASARRFAPLRARRRIWWAWPLWLISHVPGVRPLLRVGYRVVAGNRHCLGGLCGRRHRHTAFLELP